MYCSNHQGHQPITGQRRILCKLENCCCETFNQSKTERHYTIKLLTSQQPKLHIHNKHCDDYDLLSENQSTCGKHYSCETSFLRMTNDILWNVENKLVTAVTLLDLSAAFDTVDHDILLEVLHNKFGIDGNALKWYSNYLKPRKFKVNIN